MVPHRSQRLAMSPNEAPRGGGEAREGMESLQRARQDDLLK